MGLNQRKYESWTILDVEGAFSRSEIRELKDICSNTAGLKNKKIAVNFENLDLIDSTGLGALIHCDKLINDRKGRFVLINLHENIYNLLEMTTVDKMLTIRDTEEDLLEL